MILNDLPKVMVYCLLLTIIIEIIVSLIIGVREKKDLLNILLVNVLTNPLVASLPMLIMLRYGMVGRYVCLVILEIMTVIVEGFIYEKVLKYKKINHYGLSLILNISSYLIGEIISRFL